MTLQEKIQELEEKLQAIATRGLDIPADLAENLDVFERVAGQMLVMADEVLDKGTLESESEPVQEVVESLEPQNTQDTQALQQTLNPYPIASVFTATNETSDSDNQDQPAGIPVLLVEDNLVNRKLAVLILEKVGCLVDVAINGQEGVDLFRAGNYAAIFMDCQMPVLDGYAATRAIRELEKASGSHIPIIAVTANAMKGDREKCIECGMDDYIAKPLMPNDLHEAVSRWCMVTA